MASVAARFVLLAVAFVAALAPGALSDPAPLQDICVADLKAATTVDGFPC
jgi:hypothetical protein